MPPSTSILRVSAGIQNGDSPPARGRTSCEGFLRHLRRRRDERAAIADAIAWRTGYMDFGGQKGAKFTKMKIHAVPYRASCPRGSMDCWRRDVACRPPTSARRRQEHGQLHGHGPRGRAGGCHGSQQADTTARTEGRTPGPVACGRRESRGARPGSTGTARHALAQQRKFLLDPRDDVVVLRARSPGEERFETSSGPDAVTRLFIDQAEVGLRFQ